MFRADLMNELYGGRAGILDTSVGKASKVFPGHFCEYIIVTTTTACAAGDIMAWNEGLGNEGKALKRASNSRMAAGVALDAAAINGTLRMAIRGFVDCAYYGTARTAVGDLMGAGDAASHYHQAAYNWNSNQMGHSASKTDTNYSAGWVRLFLNINQR